MEDHSVTRFVFNVNRPYAEFCAEYEASVPALAPAHLAELVAKHTAWDEVVADANDSAPHSFYIFWKMDVAPIMRLAGNMLPCTEYLMGNHTIAERMFRHDPIAMLYVPLRTLIYEDKAHQTQFVIDQPSALLGSFGNEAIAAVGRELDDHLAKLLEALHIPLPRELRQTVAAR
jgi:uncharacterized protein (DUF302 family)